MAFTRTKKELASKFEFTIDCMRESGTDVAKAESLHTFSVQLGYLDAALAGGKISTEDATKQAKDLYKVWKAANKSIDIEA